MAPADPTEIVAATAYIGLGSNVGQREGYIAQALAALAQEPGITLLRTSPYYETEPVGGPAGQGLYINAVVEIETTLSPPQLLAFLLRVEEGLGRVRQERNGPRTLDLDLLLYEQRIINEPGLIVPHPRMHERLFVLRPLADLAPGLTHPVLGCTMANLLARHEKIRPFAGGPPPPGHLLAGLRAMVTGSTSGIGRAIALAMADAGASVVTHGRTSQSAADAAAHGVRVRGGRSAVLLADLRDTSACLSMVEDAWRLWGGIDVWINNAGADTLTGEAAAWPFERKLEELQAVDVRATLLLSRVVGERMQAAGSGVILNMGWDQAEYGMEGDSGQLFAAAKGAIMAFTRSLAVSLAPQVRVNCLAPGWIRTAWGEQASSQWHDRVLRETPLSRWGLPQDVAAAACWLASPAASFITGQIIRVDGGSVRT